MSVGNTSEISTSNTPKSHDFQGKSSLFCDIALPEISTVEISGGNKSLSWDMQIFLEIQSKFADFGLFEVEISEVLPVEISVIKSKLSSIFTGKNMSFGHTVDF